MYGLKTIHDDFIHLHQSYTYSVILLQIVMVSPGTHLVKNHESQSRTIESQFKNQQVEDRLQNSLLQFTGINIYSYCKAQHNKVLKEISII